MRRKEALGKWSTTNKFAVFSGELLGFMTILI